MFVLFFSSEPQSIEKCLYFYFCIDTMPLIFINNIETIKWFDFMFNYSFKSTVPTLIWDQYKVMKLRSIIKTLLKYAD